MKDKLIKRLTQLYTLELINVFLLPILFAAFARDRGPIGMNAIASMILNAILLLEGSWLWFCMRRQLKDDQQTSVPDIFRSIKSVNLVLIAFVIVFVCIHPFLSVPDRIGTVVFLTLAVLEHINYFEVQLMYDNRNDINFLLRYRRLKKARLKVFFERGQAEQ